MLPLIVPSKWKGLTCPLSRSEVKNSRHGINCFTFYNNWCQRLLEITIIYFLHGGDFAPSQLILAEGIGKKKKKRKLSGWNSCSISANHFHTRLKYPHHLRESYERHNSQHKSDLFDGFNASLKCPIKDPTKQYQRDSALLWMESKIFPS